MDQPYGHTPDLFASEQRSLPNSTAVLVLGILSIVFCFICGIVAMALASGDMRQYAAQPQLYSEASYSQLRAGRICAIIGLCIWAALALFYLVVFAFAFSFASFQH